MHRHRSVLFEPDAAEFLGRRSGLLEEAAEAEPTQLAALLAFLLALGKTLDVAEFQRTLEQGREVAAVIDVLARRLVGNFLCLDMIELANTTRSMPISRAA